MRNFLIVVLFLGVVGYYFDISPTDFLPSLPNNDASRERHVSSAAPQAHAAPAQPSPTGTPVTNSDGSLSSRWGSPKP